MFRREVSIDETGDFVVCFVGRAECFKNRDQGRNGAVSIAYNEREGFKKKERIGKLDIRV